MYTYTLYYISEINVIHYKVYYNNIINKIIIKLIY